MKVQAKELGYFDLKLRKEGDVFNISPIEDKDGNMISEEKQFSEKWMKKVGSNTPVTSGPKRGRPSKVAKVEEDDAQVSDDVI